MNEPLVAIFFTFLNFGIVSACICWIIITKGMPVLRASAQKWHDADEALRKEEHVLAEECALVRFQTTSDEKEAERLHAIVVQWHSARNDGEQKKREDQKQQRDYLRKMVRVRQRYVADCALQRDICNKAMADASDELQAIFADPKAVITYCNKMFSKVCRKESL